MYPKGNADPIDTTLRFPTGDVPVTLFEIDISTNDAMADDPDPSHEPKYFDLYQHFDNYADLDQLLHKYQQTLGISNEDLKIAGPEGTAILQGFVHDWLSLEVQVRTSVSHGWNIIYTLAVDQYHNPAVDQILHGNSMTLDLTHRPTRADLAFLPSYDEANVWPLPGQTIDLALRTDGGTAVLSVDDSITSFAPGPKNDDHPSKTAFLISGSRTDIRRMIRHSSKALGLDSTAATKFLESPGEKSFLCQPSEYVSCAITVGYRTGTVESRQASLELVLTYHDPK